MTKSEYNRQWYNANRSYKKTCSRLQYRVSLYPEYSGIHQSYKKALQILHADRGNQVYSGRWIDERNFMPYTGITNPDGRHFK